MMDSNPREHKITVFIEDDHYFWLREEKRRRERSMAWIINHAITQYRKTIERSRKDSDE